MTASESTGELIYVSWGGTGRGAALRAAFDQAAEGGHALTYLAILDPPTFGDLDAPLLALVAEELDWLLNAHMRTVDEVSPNDVAQKRVIVRVGEVDDEVEDVAEAANAVAIVLGAPVRVGGNSVEELVAALQTRTGVPVTIVDLDATADE